MFFFLVFLVFSYSTRGNTFLFFYSLRLTYHRRKRLGYVWRRKKRGQKKESCNIVGLLLVIVIVIGQDRQVRTGQVFGMYVHVPRSVRLG